MDVALVSSRVPAYPDPDEQPLLDALAEAGLDAQIVGWDDGGFDWQRPKLSVLRSTWNYQLHYQAFLAWCDTAATQTRLLNPPEVVHWNSHKRYLHELEARGLPVTPTVVLERGAPERLADVMAERGWQDVVIKPAVSASSYKTQRVRADEVAAGETFLRALVEERDVLVQRYLPSVESYGERALVWIDGEVSHAVRKQPRFAGDDEVVSMSAVDIEPAERTLAERVLESIETPLLYARIDVAPGPDGEPLVMELELIEPSLFLIQHPPAMARFVAAMAKHIAR